MRGSRVGTGVRMSPLEKSAIFWAFIKLPISIKTFVLPILKFSSHKKAPYFQCVSTGKQ